MFSPLEDDGIIFGQSRSCEGDVIELLLFEPDREVGGNRRCLLIEDIADIVCADDFFLQGLFPGRKSERCHHIHPVTAEEH